MFPCLPGWNLCRIYVFAVHLLGEGCGSIVYGSWLMVDPAFVSSVSSTVVVDNPGIELMVRWFGALLASFGVMICCYSAAALWLDGYESFRRFGSLLCVADTAFILVNLVSSVKAPALANGIFLVSKFYGLVLNLWEKHLSKPRPSLRNIERLMPNL